MSDVGGIASVDAPSRPARMTRKEQLRWRGFRAVLRMRQWAAMPTASRRALPDFLVVGGQRCGTTSIYRYLDQHPSVLFPRLTKGTHWFDEEYHRSRRWYRSNFPLERVRDARRTGEEYLLQRNLYRRLSTGEPVAHWVSHFTYPCRAYYNVLNAADYFRAAALHDGTAHDERMAEAIDIIRDARQPDGTWLQGRRHPGRVWFELDVPAGEPSKWLTLHALRVLDWWDSRETA